MAKVRVTRDITVTAYVDIEVAEHVDGTYRSAKDRAIEHVRSLIAIGAPVAWSFDPPKVGYDAAYNFSAALEGEDLEAKAEAAQ